MAWATRAGAKVLRQLQRAPQLCWQAAWTAVRPPKSARSWGPRPVAVQLVVAVSAASALSRVHRDSPRCQHNSHPGLRKPGMHIDASASL